ncbi:MAG: hypothetical protein JWL85_287 [Candidatus Saccharibacteria bacterium]|nr:hypothetical protein [Candidatus Saccharibacteria bacterium]
MRILNQHGSMGFLDLFIIMLVVGGLMYGGARVAQNTAETKAKQPITKTVQQPPVAANTKITWEFDEEQSVWVAKGGTAPACSTPLLKQSPVDPGLATSVLYPGQYRGNNYKAHGGLAFDNLKATDVMVRAPMDADMTGLVRYIEKGEIQYLMTFTNSCGVSYRFDHVYALPPKLQAVADKLPAPKIDDTGGLPLSTPVPVKAGEIIATAVGHPKTNNIAVDFGVYDLRTPNDISKNATWAALHTQYRAQDFYGRCWLEMLPSTDSARVKKLPARDQKSGAISDYCSTAAGNTLSVNGGRP